MAEDFWKAGVHRLNGKFEHETAQHRRQAGWNRFPKETQTMLKKMGGRFHVATLESDFSQFTLDLSLFELGLSMDTSLLEVTRGFGISPLKHCHVAQSLLDHVPSHTALPRNAFLSDEVELFRNLQ